MRRTARIGVIVVFVVAMVLCSAKIFADDYELYGEGYDTATIEIIYHQPSTYTILIPATIDFSDGASYTFTAASLNICDNQAVVVNAVGLGTGNKISLSSGNKVITKEFMHSDSSFSVNENCAAVFTGDDLNSQISFWLNDDPESFAKAGLYTGTIEFEISVVDRG